MTQIKRAADWVTSKLLMWVLTGMGCLIIYFLQDMHNDFKAMGRDIIQLKVDVGKQETRLNDFGLKTAAKHEPFVYLPQPQ